MSYGTPSSSHSKGADTIDIGRATALLLAHKWTIMCVTFLFAIAGAIYAMLLPPIYRADALLQVEQTSSSNPLSEGVGLLSGPPASHSEIEIINSRMVLGPAVDILNLDLVVKPARLPVVGDFLSRIGLERPWLARGWRFTWAGESIDIEAMTVDDAYRDTEFTLRVLDERTYSLHFDGTKLGEGKAGEKSEFLNGDLHLEVEAIGAPPGAEFSISRTRPLVTIAEVRKALSVSEQGKETGILKLKLTGEDPRAAEAILRTIVDIYVTQNIQYQSEEARKSLEFLSQQLPSVRSELTEAENQLNSYRIDRESIDLSLETQSVLERLVNIEGKINELEFSEAEISRRFTPTHPTYAALLDKKRQLQKERATIEEKIDRLPETQQEVLRLQRDASVNQEIYVQLRNKMQEMQIAEASTVGNVRVLDDAEVFPKPIAPKKKFILVVAALLGALVATGLVLVVPLLKRGVQTLEQLQLPGLPVLAAIPLAGNRAAFIPRRKRHAAQETFPSGPLALRRPADATVEALRSLRTSLDFNMKDRSRKCVMVAGPGGGAGKTFIAVNLAVLFAQLGRRVVLIDGDMRGGQIHKMLGGAVDKGLCEVLSAGLALEEVLHPSGVENLSFIGRGTIPSNPSELLAKPAFAQLISSCNQHFDLVIVDSPSVLAVTDAAIIGRHAGFTLLVARYQSSSLAQVEAAVRRLRSAGVAVDGAVLNGMGREASHVQGHGDFAYA